MLTPLPWCRDWRRNFQKRVQFWTIYKRTLLLVSVHPYIHLLPPIENRPQRTDFLDCDKRKKHLMSCLSSLFVKRDCLHYYCWQNPHFLHMKNTAIRRQVCSIDFGCMISLKDYDRMMRSDDWFTICSLSIICCRLLYEWGCTYSTVGCSMSGSE